MPKPKPTPPPIAARRAPSLAKMQERFGAVEARLKHTHGLVLSQQVMVLAAFCDSLDPDERRALANLGLGLWGIGDWFRDGGLERSLKPGLDARVHARFRCDAPEFVTVMSGGADGLHFGHWYDLPAKLPRLIALSYARDTALAEVCVGRSFLSEIQRRARRAASDGVDAAALLPALADFEELDAHVAKTEWGRTTKQPPRLQTLRGLGPYLTDALPLDPTWPSLAARRAAYTGDPDQVHAWIVRAQDELGGGHPGLALLVGNDLHFLDRDRGQARDLLVAGYRALGRDALAEIVIAHDRHRDLASVDAYAG